MNFKLMCVFFLIMKRIHFLARYLWEHVEVTVYENALKNLPHLTLQYHYAVRILHYITICIQLEPRIITIIINLSLCIFHNRLRYIMFNGITTRYLKYTQRFFINLYVEATYITCTCRCLVL